MSFLVILYKTFIHFPIRVCDLLKLYLMWGFIIIGPFKDSPAREFSLPPCSLKMATTFEVNDSFSMSLSIASFPCVKVRQFGLFYYVSYVPKKKKCTLLLSDRMYCTGL